jgi:flagellar biosynthesis protein flhB|nr:EscU/YscU/HrcU family type III secretion system export apparatus switch protein [uncultured Selenomonas sp.]
MPEQWNMDAPAEEVSQEQEQRAVAIKYDVKKDRAPRVTAKGRSLVADRILAEAKKNGVPVYQNKSLVNMLMALEIDREIPPELYRTIAEILAYVYRIDKKMGGRRAPL